MLVGYARTSTTEQEAGLEAQRRELLAAGKAQASSRWVARAADSLEAQNIESSS